MPVLFQRCVLPAMQITANLEWSSRVAGKVLITVTELIVMDHLYIDRGLSC